MSMSAASYRRYVENGERHLPQPMQIDGPGSEQGAAKADAVFKRQGSHREKHKLSDRRETSPERSDSSRTTQRERSRPRYAEKPKTESVHSHQRGERSPERGGGGRSGGADQAAQRVATKTLPTTKKSHLVDVLSQPFDERRWIEMANRALRIGFVPDRAHLLTLFPKEDVVLIAKHLDLLTSLALLALEHKERLEYKYLRALVRAGLHFQIPLNGLEEYLFNDNRGPRLIQEIFTNIAESHFTQPFRIWFATCQTYGRSIGGNGRLCGSAIDRAVHIYISFPDAQKGTFLEMAQPHLRDYLAVFTYNKENLGKLMHYCLQLAFLQIDTVRMIPKELFSEFVEKILTQHCSYQRQYPFDHALALLFIGKCYYKLLTPEECENWIMHFLSLHQTLSEQGRLMLKMQGKDLFEGIEGVLKENASYFSAKKQADITSAFRTLLQRQ